MEESLFQSRRTNKYDNIYHSGRGFLYHLERNVFIESAIAKFCI